MKIYFFTACVLALGTITASADTHVVNMRVCGLTEPLGLDSTPTFAWQTESDKRGLQQQAYQIVVTNAEGCEVWNSGRVESRKQNDIKYEGTALSSCSAYRWTVTVWDANESSQAESSFETAFLSADEWQGEWIAPDAASAVRSRFDVPMQEAVKTRYVKVSMTKPGMPASTDASNSYYQLTEIEIMSGGTNVAKGCKVLSDHDWNKTWSDIINYGWAPQYLTDGIIVGTTNGYTSYLLQNLSDKSAYVTIDLGKEVEVEGITLYPRQSDCSNDGTHACNFPVDFTVESSADNEAYSVIYTAQDMEAPEFADLTGRIPYIGTTFSVPTGKTIKRARMYATALGIFTMEIDGKPVTDARLEPGETQYDKTVLYSTYDVTSLLHEGANRILAQVAGGIYNVTTASGRYTKPEIHNAGTPSLKAELHVEYTDGTSDVLLTDDTWRTALSPTLVSNWWAGEDYDATKRFDTRDISSWSRVRVVSPTTNLPIEQNGTNPVGTLKSRDYDPLRVVETWKAVKVTKLGDKHYVVDFGRNFAGQYTFTLRGERGENIRLQPGETLDPDGGCNIQYYYSSNSLTYDAYTFAGDTEAETWGPTFMYHGFRYLEITGLTTEPSPDNFTAMRIRSDMTAVSEFETSNTLINQIHTICRDAIQSQLYNSITDCPQREKLGWLDVPNEMYNSLICNYDMEAFWRKVLLDCFDGQTSTGKVPSTTPHYMNVYDDDPNWGGTAVMVPYRSLRTYGDQTTVERYYPQMKRLVDYYTSLTKDYIMPGSEYSVLSDWGQNTCGLANETAPEFTITTTYYYLLRCMAEMAELTNRPTDAATFHATSEKVKEAFNKRFFNAETCVYAHGNQAEYGMALYYGLVEDEYRQRVVENLVKSVSDANYKIKTGEIGLKPLFMSLAEGGHNDVVWRMANQTDYPSYGYWVKQGCTTTPEYWDLSLSQNHCMMDHIEEWFFSQLAGIRNTGTGFDTFTIQPYIPADLAQMRIATHCVYGKIMSSYERAGKGIRYQFTVPTNSMATIIIPLAEGCDAMTEEGKPLEAGKNGIISVEYTDSLATIVTGSGTYTFVSGTLKADDAAVSETFWTPIQNAAQLTEGSLLKMQETAGLMRYMGTCNANIQSEGGFVTGSTFDQTPALTLTADRLLVDAETGYGWGYAQADGSMLGWRKEAHQAWDITIAAEGIAYLHCAQGYVRWWNGDTANPYAGIHVNGTEANAQPLYIHKLFTIDETDALAVGKPLIYYRQASRTGDYEAIALPFDVDEAALPTNFSFFRPVSQEGDVLEVELTTTLAAGYPYLMRYEGNATSSVPVELVFSGTITTLDGTTNILTPTFQRDGDLYPFRANITQFTDIVEVKLPVGIERQAMNSNHNAPHYYSLCGTRVSRPTRTGIYIVDGKKTLINIQ